MSIRTALIVSVIAAVAVVAACSDAEDVKSGSAAACSDLATASFTAEKCAIQIAKDEIARRDGEIAYSKFVARYDSATQSWIVMAAVEPMVPGGHIFVSIAQDGTVRDFTPGR